MPWQLARQYHNSRSSRKNLGRAERAGTGSEHDARLRYKLDVGQDKVVGFVQGMQNLIAGDSDSVRPDNAALDFNEAQLAGAVHTALNTVTQILYFAVSWLKAQRPFCFHG